MRPNGRVKNGVTVNRLVIRDLFGQRFTQPEVNNKIFIKIDICPGIAMRPAVVIFSLILVVPVITNDIESKKCA